MLLMAIMNSENYQAFEASKKRRLVVTRFGKRFLDVDNLYGGLKVIIDALRGHKLIVDDSEKWLELHANQKPLAKGFKPYSELTLEDL